MAIVTSNYKYVSGKFNFEKAEWPAETGDEQDGQHFEDIRKHLNLLLHPAAGHYVDAASEPDWDYLDGRTGYAAAVAADPAYPGKIGIAFADVIFWKGHKWICAYPSASDADIYTTLIPEAKHYGINNEHLYTEISSGVWHWDETYSPPDDINPELDVWVTHNAYWRLAPDDNFYHDRDKHSPTYEAIEDTTSTDAYLYLANAKECLPEQIDSDLTHDGQGDNSTGGKGKNRSTFDETDYRNLVESDITRFIDQKKEILCRHLTQIESLGTKYQPDYVNKDGDIAVNYYGKSSPQAGGEFPDHDPLEPVIDSRLNAITQLLFDPKVCCAYQNAVVRVIEGSASNIYLPVDNDYKNNRAEYDQWVSINSTSTFDEGGTGPWETLVGTNNSWSNVLRKRYSTVDSKWHLYRLIAPGTEYYGTYTYEGVWYPDDWLLADVVWDELVYPEHQKFASIKDAWWGCNESGIECLLKYIGEYDWWFDTEHVYIPNHILYARRISVEHYADGTSAYHNQHQEPATGGPFFDDYTADEQNTAYPTPIGTWRRCFRYTFGRPDLREVCDWDATDEDTIALTKTLMRPSSFGMPEQATGCGWKPLTPVTTHKYYYNGDTPIANPIAATFEVPDFPMPWPGYWDGATKHGLWIGHNWAGVGVRPTHRDYFDDDGETFSQYSPAPDYDGRPVFDMLESLRDIESPTEDEQALIAFMDSLAERHDPAQIIDGIKEYEIFADMLNDMREILLNARLTKTTLPIEMEWTQVINNVECSATGAEAVLNSVAETISIPLEVPYTDPLPSAPPGASITDFDVECNIRPIVTPSGGTVHSNINLVAWRFLGLKNLGYQNCAEIFIRMKLQYHGSSDPDDNDYATPAIFSIEGGETLTTISTNTNYGGYAQPEKYYWVQCAEFTGTEDSPWMGFTFDPTSWIDEIVGGVPSPPTELWSYYMNSELIGGLDGSILLEYDWDKIDAAVFDTPNVKGLKQVE